MLIAAAIKTIRSSRRKETENPNKPMIPPTVKGPIAVPETLMVCQIPMAVPLLIVESRGMSSRGTRAIPYPIPESTTNTQKAVRVVAKTIIKMTGTRVKKLITATLLLPSLSLRCPASIPAAAITAAKLTNARAVQEAPAPFSSAKKGIIPKRAVLERKMIKVQEYAVLTLVNLRKSYDAFALGFLLPNFF